MAGLVLPADTFGSHLHNGETIDEELEKKNFEAAGRVLAEIWDKMEIDGKPLIAEYVPEGVDDKTKGFQVSATFKSRHLIQTQYMTIVLKCDDPLCCSPFKTDIDRFFPGRRVPPLIPIKFSTSGPVALDLEPNVHQKKLNFLDVFSRLVMEKQLLPANLKTKYNGIVPYNVYFPTLQEKVKDRTCRLCGQYFSVKISLAEHKRICKRNKELNIAQVVGEEDVLVEDIDDELDMVELRPLISIPQRGGVEKIVNLAEWMKSPWALKSD